LFRNAIELEFEKDKEYGYKHISSLSGGLDSRMVTWVAHEMGYCNMLNYCFSQSDYLDERISKKIASDLEHDYVFKALDNGNYLKDIENMIKVNFGNALYIGSAHGKSFVDLIKWNKYGLVHTGQLGDVILGTYYTSNKENKPFQIGDGGYSKKLVERLKSINLKEKYENQEIFNFYNRGFNGVMQGNLPSQEYTEVASPFLDVDFMNYCLKIPLKYRWNHFIYFEWIKRKYPKAANYKWEKINAKISSIKINILGRQVVLINLPRKIIKKVIKKISGKNGILLGESMNPIDYWYESNKSLKEFFFRVYDNDMAIFDADITQIMQV
jgi:asparagine synthase (glutamine-hydrolysing)